RSSPPRPPPSFPTRRSSDLRGICGASSGGICAFTAAWERPDLFSKVLSHIGSFTNIRGGDRYPGIIRRADKKDIRVFLQDGTNEDRKSTRLNSSHQIISYAV